MVWQESRVGIWSLLGRRQEAEGRREESVGREPGRSGEVSAQGVGRGALQEVIASHACHARGVVDLGSWTLDFRLTYLKLETRN